MSVLVGEPKSAVSLSSSASKGRADVVERKAEIAPNSRPFPPIMLPPPPAGGKNAATGWLLTSAPALNGTIITLRFAIWDSGDAILDSLVLIDNFQWSEEIPEIRTVPIVVD